MQALRFNSYMVRLEDQGGSLVQRLLRCFNSYMVRLEDPSFSIPLPPVRVSIPIWCDWKFAGSGRYKGQGDVSIPIWCDWKAFGWLLFFCTRFVSIPIWCDWKITSMLRDCFDLHVSIPIWCDWKHTGRNLFGKGQSFNSYMVRLEE